MNSQQYSLPALRRMMVFVDGENLVYRYQAMLDAGRTASDTRITHEKDTFVWRPFAVSCDHHIVLRATYYTYCIGDEAKVRAMSERIKSLEFRQYSVPGVNVSLLRNLSPRVFRKPRGRKAKGVDIQMTVDVLTNVYQDNLDTVYLVSGDGDYIPVLQEAIRRGKQVYIAALSDGLNEELKLIADRFIDLDGTFFQRPAASAL